MLCVTIVIPLASPAGSLCCRRIFLKVFVVRCIRSNKKIYLDTNGTLPKALEAVIKDIDIIAMDIKLPSSTRQKAYWAEHKEFLKIARRREVFVKVVVALNTRRDQVLKAAQSGGRH